MIDCDLVERKEFRKVVNRKKGVKEEKTGRKEIQRCEKLFTTCTSLHR